MSEYQILTVFAAFAFFYSLVASKMEKTPISGALVYVAVGAILGPRVLGLIDLDVDGEAISRLAELALAVCLFSDSACADLGVLKRIEKVPIRLLLIGLPLTILLGMVVGWAIFRDLAFVEIALIATMLAPTDAALGKPVVSNPVVPTKVRQSLNVESGLNDGICVPVILFFIEISRGTVEAGGFTALMTGLLVKVIGIGVVVGIVLALVGGFALRHCASRGWISGTWMHVPIVSLAVFCFALAQLLGGSGFIAAFVGGMTFGACTKKHKEQFLESAEVVSDAVALVTWFTFGTIIVGFLLTGVSWQVIVYSLLSLTVIRMLPVALCMWGVPTKKDTLMFMGWFGPRGLASIVFLVMVMQEKLPDNDTIVAVVSWTIVFSVIAHGLSANPLAAKYGARVEARGGEL